MKNSDVYPSNSDGIVCGIYFWNTKYFFHSKNLGTSRLVSIYLQISVILQILAIIYAKTVTCTLLTLTGSSVAYVSVIHSIFFRVKIVFESAGM